MKRGILLALALLLIGIGVFGISGYKTTTRPVVKQASSSVNLKTTHDLAKLKQKGILFAESKQTPAINKEQALEIARQALANIQLSEASVNIEYWDVAHVSKSGQQPAAMPCWVISFPGLQLPADQQTGEARTELTVFVDAINGGVVYMCSYR